MAELEPRNFLQPLLLLLLRERADHGYELVSRLRPMHDGDGDAGGVYRALRGLERHGLVRSEWQTSDVGPARRIYRVTPDGLACLEGQVHDLEHVHEVLHLFLDRYARVVEADRSLRPGQVSGGRPGTDRAGTDRAGTDRAGTDRAGTDRAGGDRRSGARPTQPAGR